MDLWIRNKYKKILEKAETIKIAKYEEDDSYSIVVNNDYVFGEYQTAERAFEILNEIQQHMVNKYYLIPKEKLTQEEKRQLMDTGQFNSKIDVVSTLEKMELKPLNNNVYIYEMPKE